MAIKIGSRDVAALYLGERQTSVQWLGNSLVRLDISPETELALTAFDVQPSPRLAVTLDKFIRRIVASGAYQQLDFLHVGALHTAQASRVNILNPGTFDLVPNNSPVFTAYRGYRGNGTTSDLRIDGYRPLSMSTTKYKLDDATLGAFTLTNYAGFRALIGHTNWGCYVSPRNGTSIALGRMNHASTEGPDLSYAVTDSVGMLVGVRRSATTQFMYKNGVQIAENNTPSRPSLNTMNADMRVGSGGAAGFGTDEIALSFGGASLAPEQIADIHDAFSDYLTTIGSGFDFGVVINGESYVPHNDKNATYAFSSQFNNNLQRFEVRAGDVYSGDIGIPPPRERSELLGQTKLPNNNDIWISFSQFVEFGEENQTEQNIIGQLHATEDIGDPPSYPIVFLNMNREAIELRTASFDVPSPHPYPPQPITRWSQENYERGVWHNWVMRIVVNPAGGELDVWFNGEEIYSGTPPIGYRDVVGPYFIFGMYRFASSNTVVIRYANMEVGTADLSDRIENPLPIPGP